MKITFSKVMLLVLFVFSAKMGLYASEIDAPWAAGLIQRKSPASPEEKSPLIASKKRSDEGLILVTHEIPKSAEDKLSEEFSSCLGGMWDLFRQGKYDILYGHVFMSATRNHDPYAQYLLGEFYEKGLGGIHQSAKDAFKWYMAAFVNVDNHSTLLKNKIYQDLGRFMKEANKSMSCF